MKRIIRLIKIRIVELVNRIAWKKQYRSIISGTPRTNFKQCTGWVKGSNILIMVPHADDELISSYSILCNADNVTIYYCGFTGSNNTDDNRKIRRNEILSLCTELKIKIIEGNNKCDNLEAVIRGGGYNIILLPSIVDWHAEHRKVSYMINDVCLKLNITPNIYCYSVTVPNESSRDVFCSPLSEVQLRKKYDLFANTYVSQKNMSIDRLKLNDRINGYWFNCFAGETFVNYDFEEWSNIVYRVKPLEGYNESKLQELVNSLRKNLNNLIFVRECARDFYNWIEEE